MMKLRKKRPEMLTTRAAVVATMLLLSVLVRGQSAPIFPRETKRVHLKRYINDVLGFELSYPSSYHREELPVPSPTADRAETKSQLLMQATTGKDEALCEDEGQCDKFGRIFVALDHRGFDLQTIGEHYEHTGWTQPQPFRVGAHTFYYIGAGGGGVNYPDTFFYNLHGRILIIEFIGPYPPDSKSPSDATRGFEKIVLESFRLQGKRQPNLH